MNEWLSILFGESNLVVAREANFLGEWMGIEILLQIISEEIISDAARIPGNISCLFVHGIFLGLKYTEDLDLFSLKLL